jgi:hypothetical protein
MLHIFYAPAATYISNNDYTIAKYAWYQDKHSEL